MTTKILALADALGNLVRFVLLPGQRYDTIGDYVISADGHIHITVSDLGDSRFNVLVALHELVEVLLTENAGIPEGEIMAFDLAHLDTDDPGNIPDAPYHRQHVFADCLERLFAREMGVNWQEYEAACLAVSP